MVPISQGDVIAGLLERRRLLCGWLLVFRGWQWHCLLITAAASPVITTQPLPQLASTTNKPDATTITGQLPS